MMAQGPVFVGFGEVMLRLTTQHHQRLVQASEFDVAFTGAEANVAGLLSQLGVESRVVSRVPEGELGQACINFLRRLGIDTRSIARGGDRLGLFYLEPGIAQRASRVIYDRGRTSFSTSESSHYDWEACLDGADWLHFSGTAPALGESVRQVLFDGLAQARRRGVPVSCDLNYREGLWSRDEARSVMSEFMPLVDVLFGNEEDAENVFGIRAAGSDVTKGKLPVESYRSVAEQLTDRFELRMVATTLRESVSASTNDWAGMVFDGSRHYVSRSYRISPIVDRVGGGDAFAGGLIYGLLNDDALQDAVEFAVAASCLKHSVVGDIALVSLDEIRRLASGDESGRVRR